MRYHRLVSILALACCLVLTFSSTGLASAGTLTAPSVFDPAEYGRVLSDAELDLIDGEAWPVLASVAIGVTTHIVFNGFEPTSGDWWLGLAGSVALSVIPVSGAQVASSGLSGAAAIAMDAWGVVTGTVVTTGPQAAAYFSD